MAWEVPLVELEVTDSDVDSVLECLRSGWLTMGPRTQALEEAIAEMVGTEHAIVVSSGTAALHLACRALGLGPGDEVIVPSFTFAASAHAPRYGGAEVVLCDSVSPRDPNLDPAAVESLVSPRTRAVIAVHMWGYPAAVEELRGLCDRHGLALIEDCAEAICARLADGGQVGSVGELGCFSFFSKKQLAVGEGGAVTTDDDELAATVRSLRSHAMTSVTWERHRGHGLGYDITDVGFNYRIDEPRAALALSRFERLGADIEARREVARAYREQPLRRRGPRDPLQRGAGRPLFALRLFRARPRPRAARPPPHGASRARHPDDLLPGTAHAQRVPRWRFEPRRCRSRPRSASATWRCRSTTCSAPSRSSWSPRSWPRQRRAASGLTLRPSRAAQRRTANTHFSGSRRRARRGTRAPRGRRCRRRPGSRARGVPRPAASARAPATRRRRRSTRGSVPSIVSACSRPVPPRGGSRPAPSRCSAP